MIFEHREYRGYLKSVLAGNNEAQKICSLRAFADRLGISSSFLSEVINARKNLSVELAFKIGLKLNLTDLETQYLCLLVHLEQETDPEFKDQIKSRLAELNPNRPGHDLSVDLFKSISDWYHSAILELTYLHGFRLEPAGIVRVLGITKAEAELALERLERLELLERDAKGRLRKVHNDILTEAKIPNSAFKAFHAQLLTKATEALVSQAPATRISATDILAIDSKYLKHVDRLSREFSSAVLRLADKSKIKDSIYALSVHFFRVTKDSEA